MKTPYSQPIAPSQTTPKGLGIYAGEEHQSSIIPWIFLSIGSHLSIIFLIWFIGLILTFFGLVPKFDNLAMKPRDVEFVLVDNLPKEKPRKPTRNRAAHESRSGGQKTNKLNEMPQQAAGSPNKVSKASSQPAAKPQPAPRPARPAQQPRMAQAPSRPQPQQPKQQQQPAPTPHPTPPAPKMPKPVKIASASPILPPSPTMPTIRTPAPKNPSTSGASGPVVKTSGSSGSPGASGSSGASGNPGPSMISGSPSRGGSGHSGGRTGGGGNNGRGSYNQSGSPGGGGGRPGIDAEAEPDFGPYVAELQRRIKRNWVPPTADQSKRVVASFRISREGRLLAVSIIQSSGSPPADQAAMAAVRASAPFRQLPPNYKGSDIAIHFTFDYEISGHGSASIH